MELAIVGEDEQSFGIKIESAHGIDPPFLPMEKVSNGRPSKGIIESRNTPPRFVQKEVCLGLKLTDRFPVDPDMVLSGIGLEAKICNYHPIYLYPALYNEFLGMTTGSVACFRHDLLKSFPHRPPPWDEAKRVLGN